MLKIPISPADHMQGDPAAPVILVEYGDYQCPHCGHAYPIVKRVQKHFGKRLGFVFRNFPLNEIHPDAENAAETAEFAAAHNAFKKCTTPFSRIRTTSTTISCSPSPKNSTSHPPILQPPGPKKNSPPASEATSPAACAATSAAPTTFLHQRPTP